jgi:hypothetical protein
MTNLEKIAHLRAMHKEAVDQVAYCDKKLSEGCTDWTTPIARVACQKDAQALKFALKAIQLMQDLVKDEGGENA